MAEMIKVLLIINIVVVGLIVYVALGIITYIVAEKVQGYDWKDDFDVDEASVAMMVLWPVVWCFAMVMLPFWLPALLFKVVVKALIKENRK